MTGTGHPEPGGVDSSSPRPLTQPVSRCREAAGQVRRACEPLPSLGEVEAFGAAFGRFAGSRVVLLGEATRGTAELYRARAAITRRLIERRSFTVVAVEAGWPDTGRIDRQVRHRTPAAAQEEAFARFPTWMWRNQEVHDLVYSLRGPIAGVLDDFDTMDPAMASTARCRHGRLTPWQFEPADYGRAVLRRAKDPCEDAIAAPHEVAAGRGAAVALRHPDPPPTLQHGGVTMTQPRQLSRQLRRERDPGLRRRRSSALSPGSSLTCIRWA